jgi:hypothetical protein
MPFKLFRLSLISFVGFISRIRSGVLERLFKLLVLELYPIRIDRYKLSKLSVGASYFLRNISVTLVLARLKAQVYSYYFLGV